jgi:hypothetical protein
VIVEYIFLPVSEKAVHLGIIHFKDLVLYIFIHRISIIVSILLPFMEITEQSLAKGISSDVTSSSLILSVNPQLLFCVVGTGFIYYYIHVFLYCQLQKFEFIYLCGILQSLEACSGSEFSILVSQGDGSHVRLHQVSVVHKVIIPGLEKGVQCSLPVLFLDSHAYFQLSEHMRQVGFSSEFLVQQSYSAMVLELLRIPLPRINCLLCSSVTVFLGHPPQYHKSSLFISFLLLPDFKGSLEFFFRVRDKSRPYLLNCFLFEIVYLLFLEYILLPSEENSVCQVLAALDTSEVIILKPCSVWFQCSIIPLVKSNTLLVSSNFFEGIG